MINRRQRRSPRLQGYDYASAGVYFVTICTHERVHLFGQVVAGAMVLSPLGQIAYEELGHISAHWHAAVDVDAFVIMPNHVHAIVILVGTAFMPSGRADAQKRVPTLGMVVGAYKAGVTRRFRELDGFNVAPVWQGRYHDPIIRGEADRDTIRAYIAHNPVRWSEDTFFTA